jgi:hypothetical protein
MIRSRLAITFFTSLVLAGFVATSAHAAKPPKQPDDTAEIKMGN